MVRMQTLSAKNANLVRSPNGTELLDSVMDSAVAGFVLRNLHQKDLETYEHSERVAKFALVIGRALGLSSDELERLRLAALLHDIGKIAVNMAILSKPKKLERHEMATVRNHTELGQEFLLSVPGLERYAQVARSHHERFDGGGYPDGLRDQDIAISARIVALADAFDVMTRGRSYARSQSSQEIAAALILERGRHFDPRVVDALLEAWREGLVPGIEPLRSNVEG
jgi:putative nucleotidyltransferase with HDIG domain